MHNNLNQNPSPVIVVGGGWSGLAAAVELSKNGRAVTLIESARQLGGRARCVDFFGQPVDNGQHLMVGAYKSTLNMLQTIGVNEADALLRQPLNLRLRSVKEGNADIHLKTGKLPAPFHLLQAMVSLKGLPIADRLRAIRFGLRLLGHKLYLKKDISVQALLIKEQQSARLIYKLWEPLCLATLNTPIQDASAKIFLRVLRNAFSGSKRNSDLLIPRSDLGTTIPEPAANFIEQNGGNILLNHRVLGIQQTSQGQLQVAMNDHVINAEHVILAVDPTITGRLLAKIPELADTATQLDHLTHNPICTVYLKYPEPVFIKNTVIGVLDGVSQWVFDRRCCGQPGVMAVVISGDGPHMQLSNEELVARITSELDILFPGKSKPVKHLVIREKRATFSSCVNIDGHRPEIHTAVPGLMLAGDFSANGLPATLEGAIRNGVNCAQQLLLNNAH